MNVTIIYPTDYRSTYPKAVELWLEGKYNESVASFVKSSCQLVLKGDEKRAYAYAYERQQFESSRVEAKRHEAITDAMCHAAQAFEGIDRNRVTPENKDYWELVRMIEARRKEWQKLYGVWNQHEKAKLNAIRLKAFVRSMRLLKVNIDI